MTVSSTTNRKTFAGDNATTSFGTSPIVFFDTSDLALYVSDDTTGAITDLVENTDYTVTGGSGLVGTISLAGGSDPFGALQTGTTLVIVRVLPIVQEVDLVNNDINDAEVQETALDQLTMIAQQLDAKVGRTVRLADSDTSSGDDVILPAAADRASQALGFDATGKLALLSPTTAIQDSNDVLWAQSGSGAVSRTSRDKMRDTVSVLDYGVVAGDSSAATRTANTTALRKLVSSAANGGVFSYKGNVTFPLGQTYYFDSIICFKDGIHVDLCGSTLDFSKAESTAENQAGFIMARRDFSLKNGYINIDYTSTLANRGAGIWLNSRYADSDQAPGNYQLDNFEEDQQATVTAGSFVVGKGYTIQTVGTTDFTLIGASANTVGVAFLATGVGSGTGTAGPFMDYMPGNMELRNLRIKSNNPQAAMIQMVGGLKNVVMENVELDGQSLASTGIDYEFGGADDRTLNEDEKSSHGQNLHFRNIRAENIIAAGGAAIAIRGAYNVTVDGLYARNVYNVMNFSTGEASNYNPGFVDVAGVKCNNYFRNIVGQDVIQSGISINGTTDWANGYLGPLATQTQANVEEKQTDLIDAVLENFVLAGTSNGFGLSLDGRKIMCRNGRLTGFGTAIFENGTRSLVLEDVDLLDSTSYAMRITVGSIYVTGWTDRSVWIRGGEVSGNSQYGIVFESGQTNGLIEGVKFGYNNPATGRFTVTGGSAGAGNKLTSLTVNGTEILTGPGTDVLWTTSNANTAALIATAINAYTGTSGYTATALNGTVLIRAALGTGTTPNGYVVVPTVAGNMTVGSIKDMSGGKIETTQQVSVQVSSGLQNVTVRNCHTRKVAAGAAAYYHQDATNQNCRLENNIGDTTISGGWLTDVGSFTGTFTGYNSSVTGTVHYSVHGKTVCLNIPQSTGTSNATTKTMTGLPTHLIPATVNKPFMVVASDNGATAVPAIAFVETTGVIDYYPTVVNGANWTAAGTAFVRGHQVTYDLF